MPVYKIWSSDRKKRKAVVATTLIELIETGKKKLGIEEGESVTVVLEKDGTSVDDDEILAAFGGEVLCLLKSEEEWILDEMNKTNKDSVEDNPTAPVQSDVTSPEHIPELREMAPHNPSKKSGIIGEIEVRDQERKFATPEQQTVKQLLEQYNLDTEYWGNVLEANGIVDIDHLVCVNDYRSKQIMLSIQFDWEKDLVMSMLRECQMLFNRFGDHANEENSKALISHQCDQVKIKQKLYDQPTPNPQIYLIRQYESDLLKLIKQLNLEEYYPQQIKLLDVQKISENASGAGLPWRILRRLMARDYRAIEEETQIFNKNIQTELLTKQQAAGSSHSFQEYNTDGCLNALDVFLAVFCCCSTMLRQILFEVLFLCKLPFPIFTPMTNGKIEFSLWATRKIVINHLLNGQQVAESLARVRCQRISFLRIGNSSRSKSQTLNKLFGGRDTFFHEDSTTGNIPRAVTNGVIEACIYIPSGKMSEPLSQVTMFLNLRGDGLYLSNHLELIGLITDIHVLFLPVENLHDTRTLTQLRFLALKRTIMILTSDSMLTPTEISDHLDEVKGKLGSLYENITPVLSRQNGREKNVKVLIEEILHYLNERTNANNMSLEEVMQLIQHKTFISIDENNQACLQGKESAQEIVRQTEHYQASRCKTQILPLQGNAWKKWAKLRKDLSGRQLQLDDRNQKEIELQGIMQEISTKGPSQLLLRFIELLKVAEKGQYIEFVLQWMNILLDEKSRLTLSELHGQWLGAKKEFEKHALDEDGEMKEKLRGTLSEKEQLFLEASLGIEHFLRELGILYESSALTHTLNDFSHGLPALAVQLLLSGIPFELMDGDASYIPINWVKAVLMSLLEKIGDKKLFVLSVLGIQSSGKSTLLNTMFGLQFSVAAGRCTRGLFMQLLPVDKTSSEIPFDYILVVDTEGLRSIELGEEHIHDNVLSTFVIGLADLTIINIKGENQSEMKDILEIVIHAFLKIHIANKNLKIKQQCMFIHQNVPDSRGSDNLCHAETKFLDELNKMTLAAAEQEGIEYIHQFNQVISFAGKTDYDRWYLSDCWCGDPPMAPANPGYSEKVCEVKNIILRMAQDTGNDIHRMKLSNLFSSIEDLWSGVLSLDFIFCFRNSLELKAYSKVEEQYTTLLDDITDKANEFYRCSCIALQKCDSYEDLDAVRELKRSELSQLLPEIEIELQRKLTEYFETNEMKKITIQWKQHKLLSLKTAIERNVQSYCKKMDKFAKFCRVDLFKKTQSNNHGQKMIQNATEVARLCKGMNDYELGKKFEDIWKEMLQCLGEEKSEEKQLDIAKCFENYIKEKYRDHLQLVNPGEVAHALTVEEISSELLTYTLAKTDISPTGKFNKFKRWVHFDDSVEKYQKLAKEETFQKLDMLYHNVESKCQQHNDFEEIYVKELITTTYQILKTDRENEGGGVGFKFKDPYILRVTLLLSRYAAQKYQTLHEEFEKENSIMAKLDKMKEEAWNIFRNTAKEAQAEEMVADILCDKLRTKIYDYIHEQLEHELTKKISAHFCKRKFYLVTAVLEDLLKKNIFKYYIQYVQDPSHYVQKWLADQMKAMIFNDGGHGWYIDTAIILIGNWIQQIKNIVKDASDAATEDGPFSMDTFITKFCKQTESLVPFTEQELYAIANLTITRAENFVDLIQKNFAELEQNLSSRFSAVTNDTVRWHDESPYDAAFNRLWGCKEHCPFCCEPCQDSDPDHWREGTGSCHRSIQHKPAGICGTYSITDNCLRITSCSQVIVTGGLFSCQAASCECRKSGLCQNTYEYDQILEKRDKWHPYRDYKKVIPSWDIAPNSKLDCCKYWMWFYSQFRHDIIGHYGRSGITKLPTIPASWEQITKEEALNSLREYH